MRILSLILMIYSVTGLAQTDFALLLNAPINEKSYKNHYDRNMMNSQNAMSASGIPRTRISVLNGDGRSPYANKKAYQRDILAKGVDAAAQKADGKAKKVDIKKKFTELAKKMKSGDHLHLVITGHGVKGPAIGLWGENLTAQELKSYLKLLPKGVKTHITTNVCMGGMLMELTDENTCVFANSDEKTLTYSRTTHDDYLDNFMISLRSGISYYDASINADLRDPLNKTGSNSLDWYLANTKPYNNTYQCVVQNNDGTYDKLVREVSTIFTSNADLKKDHSKAYKKHQDDIAKLVTQFDRMSASDKEKNRGLITKNIEDLKEKIRYDKQYDHYHARLDRERDFIAKASPEQMKKYLAIRSCVNYAIKK